MAGDGTSSQEGPATTLTSVDPLHKLVLITPPHHMREARHFERFPVVATATLSDRAMRPYKEVWVVSDEPDPVVQIPAFAKAYESRQSHDIGPLTITRWVQVNEKGLLR